MSERIIIIDPDPIFSSCIESRLRRSFPEASFSFYNPEEAKEFNDGQFLGAVVLYDGLSVSADTVDRISGNDPPSGIDTCADTFPPRKKDARTLTEDIRRVLYGEGISSSFNPEGEHQPVLQQDAAALTVRTARTSSYMLLSLTDSSAREAYISGWLKTQRKENRRVIRVDLMAGISMHNPFRRRAEFRERHVVKSSGITEVLLKIDSTAFSAADLLGYVQCGTDGVFGFGLPDRSDDILDCRVETLIRLLKMLRKLSEPSESDYSVIAVAEGLPFHTLREICHLFAELHVLMPDERTGDRDLAEREVHGLFRVTPPSVTKFICEPQRGIL